MNLFFPMFFYVLYITGLGALNFRTRKKAVIEKKVKLSYMRVYSGDAPEQMIAVARHFDNQFQIPMLFFITCLATHIYIGNHIVSVILAWLFILTRILHSYVHLTSNNVLKRALFFFLGFFCVIAMWFTMLIELFIARA